MKDLEQALPNKLTTGDILATVVNTEYWRLGESTTTVCQLTLKNGFTVIGTSACIDPLEFNKPVGEQVAWDNALDKVWELEGYLLQQKRHEAGLA
jgi:hypothetical protein